MKWIAVISFSIIFASYTQAAALTGANWMTEMADKIAKKPLNQLFIPGSHDSGTYKLENTFAKGQDYTEKLNALKYVGVGFIVTSVAKNWAQTQDRTIAQQLNDGVRYLDLRVTYRDSDQDFYIAHGLFGPKFSDVLSQIRNFLQENPREIVIIQIGDLNYMGPKEESERNHERLVKLILKALPAVQKSELSGPNVRVEQLWKMKKQVFLIYKNKDVVKYFDELWSRSSIDDYWPNVDDTDSLKEKIDRHMDKRGKDDNGNKFFVTQAQMTPSSKTIANSVIPLGKRYRSLKDMAEDVVKQFPHWLDEWRNRNPNIIIMDFVNNNTAKHIYLLNNN